MVTQHVTKGRKNARARIPSPTNPLLETLKASLHGLRCIRAIVLVAVGALREQNADNDADIAVALQRAVADPLMTEIERLEKLLPRARA